MRQVFGGHLLFVLMPVLYVAAFFWRRLLRRTTFIAVTGSLGKTTTKECLARILDSQAPTARNRGTQNHRRMLWLNILRVRPWHRYAVIEVGAQKPYRLAGVSRVLSPEVVLLLNVAPLHCASLPTLDDVAAEKKRLLSHARPGRIVIVNGDEPRFSDIQTNDNQRVYRFGSTAESDLYPEQISARWPQRLRFQASSGAESVTVQTRLIGEHWVPSLLAALLAARCCGISLSQAAGALARQPPFSARLQPVRLPSGVVALRDEYNGSDTSFEAAFRVFEQARVPGGRKILVAGDYSDALRNTRKRLRRLGRRAREVSDLAIFVGPHSHHSRIAARAAGMSDQAALSFPGIQSAADHLKATLCEGDLVLLKARNSDHFSRLLFAQVGDVACWKMSCTKRILCDECWELGTASQDIRKIRVVDP